VVAGVHVDLLVDGVWECEEVEGGECCAGRGETDGGGEGGALVCGWGVGCRFERGWVGGVIFVGLAGGLDLGH